MQPLTLDVFWYLLLAGFGVLLGWSRLRAYPNAGGGEMLSLLPLLLPSILLRFQPWALLLMGVVFGLGYVGKMLLTLRLPVAVSAILACSQTFVWALFVMGAAKLWHLPSPLDILSIACFGTALFWLEWTLLPLWGTAQNFACSLPISRPFIEWFGATGGTWSFIFVAALGALASKDENYQLHQWGVALVLPVFIGV